MTCRVGTTIVDTSRYPEKLELLNVSMAGESRVVRTRQLAH